MCAFAIFVPVRVNLNISSAMANVSVFLSDRFIDQSHCVRVPVNSGVSLLCEVCLCLLKDARRVLDLICVRACLLFILYVCMCMSACVVCASIFVVVGKYIRECVGVRVLLWGRGGFGG
jgi:hypothetical protein